MRSFASFTLLLTPLFLLNSCGDLQTASLSNNSINSNEYKTNVIATNEISITLDKSLKKSQGLSIQSSNLVTSQSVEIVVTVPKFTTFNATSSLSFNVIEHTIIDASGNLILDISYNDLAATNLNNVFIRAKIKEGNGLVGQTQSGSIVPVTIKGSAITTTNLTTTVQTLKTWNAPFTQKLKESIQMNLTGDFTQSLAQQYKGTIVLEFVRTETP